MIRSSLILASLSLLVSFNVLAAGHGMCEKMDEFKKTVMADDELNRDQQNELMGHLDKAGDMCEQGKGKEAMAMMKEINDEWARSYFDSLMESGN